jgi:hypothetical protein
MVQADRSQMTVYNGAHALLTGWVWLETHIQNMQYMLPFHSNNVVQTRLNVMYLSTLPLFLD